MATETYVAKKEVVPFRGEHVDAIRPGWRSGARADIDAMDLFLRTHEERGMGETGLIDGVPIAAGGIITTLAGRGEAWVIAGPRVKDYPLFFHRALLNGIHRQIEALGLRRIDATVLFGDTTAIRWIERMGFSEEGFMPLYGPNGETHIRYARLIRPAAKRVLMAAEVSDV